MGIGSVWIVGFECLIGEFKEVGKGGVFYRVLIDGNLGVFLKLHSRWRETLHALERERDRYFIHTLHIYIYIYISKKIKRGRKLRDQIFYPLSLKFLSLFILINELYLFSITFMLTWFYLSVSILVCVFFPCSISHWMFQCWIQDQFYKKQCNIILKTKIQRLGIKIEIKKTTCLFSNDLEIFDLIPHISFFSNPVHLLWLFTFHSLFFKLFLCLKCYDSILGLDWNRFECKKTNIYLSCSNFLILLLNLVYQVKL
jgi:hypothetical protein